VITVTNNSPQQINAAILALIQQIEKLQKDYKELQDKIKKLENNTNTL
jgi:prefoldin subunit 5